MSILVKSACLICPGSEHHLKKVNIFISDQGIIEHIGTGSPQADKVVESPDLYVSMGWFDMRAHFHDPGNEHKEDLGSGALTASAGGFTGVALIPNTKPVIQTKNDVSYILKDNPFRVTQLYPYGAVTKCCEGKELTEMLDLYYAGAVGFTDGEQPIWNTDILHKSLLYLQKTGSLLINKPEDKYLNAFGNMNEGANSTLLGMKGMPAVAEEVMISRDLQLLEYAGGRMHFSNISTSGALKLIRKALKDEKDISCDVAVHNLVFDDSELMDFDSNYKVNPPLRDVKDVKALVKAINEGIVQVIVSSHTPHDPECKKLEFDLADFGMLGLQTFFPFILKASGEKEWVDWVPTFTSNPRKLLGLIIPKIAEGERADLTLFDPSLTWKYDRSTNTSKSENSPVFGTELKGKVLGIVANGKSFFNLY